MNVLQYVVENTMDVAMAVFMIVMAVALAKSMFWDD